MYKIFNFEKIKEKHNISFSDFVKLFLGIGKREEINTDNCNLKVKLDGTDSFIDRINYHVFQNNKIAIIGDYDVDGVCASAIMKKSLDLLTDSTNILTFIPNRFRDGYGLNINLVDEAIKFGCKLIITVDNGIKANEAISYAKSKNLEVIVTDHHTPDLENLPISDMIINPHIGNETLKTKEICGATTAFLLCRHLLSHNKKLNENILRELAELAAIATICDVMPLVYENRLLVKYLLNMMHRNEDENRGISMLMQVLSVGRFAFDTESVSFGLGPCLNAPGRLDTAYTSYQLLIEKDREEIERLAELVEQFNNDRKRLTVDLKKESYKQLDDSSVNVIYLPNVTEGIVGIIAGKICESTNKPTFVFTNNHKGFLKGSGRTPKWCNLIETATAALKTMSENDVVGYGGHSGAMGLSLKDENALLTFKAKLDMKVRLMNKTDDAINVIRFPSNLSLKEIKDEIDKYAPYGEGFEEPIFVYKTPINSIYPMGEEHTRFNGFLNGDLTTYYFFFNVLEPEIYEGKIANVYFRIHKDVAEKAGTTTYSCYVQDVELLN